jgi:hypothetical protein
MPSHESHDFICRGRVEIGTSEIEHVTAGLQQTVALHHVDRRHAYSHNLRSGIDDSGAKSQPQEMKVF